MSQQGGVEALTRDEHLELIELVGGYGFDLTGIGGSVLTGLDAIRDYMGHGARHPFAHHITNAHVTNMEDDCVRTSCRVIAVQLDGSVASGHYSDEFVRSPDGLRIRRREFHWLLAPQGPSPAPRRNE